MCPHAALAALAASVSENLAAATYDLKRSLLKLLIQRIEICEEEIRIVARAAFASSNLPGWDFLMSETTVSIFVGLNISKASLDFYLPYSKEAIRIENTNAPIDAICATASSRHVMTKSNKVYGKRLNP